VPRAVVFPCEFRPSSLLPDRHLTIGSEHWEVSQSDKIPASMKQNEEPALEEFTSQGWSTIRNGWPDYLLVRPRENGGLDVMGLEVKSGRDELTGLQIAVHTAMHAGGIPVLRRGG
jgi:hypothetical protein